MKNNYLLLLLLGFSASAQILTIPDTAFKNALIADNVDVNSDGQIQVSEALAVTNMQVDNSGISSLSGIESFLNLNILNCSSNSITALNISALPNLTRLICSNNLITSLDLSNQTIFQLDCRNNQIAQLVLGNVYQNELDDPFYGADLRMSGNQLTAIDLNTGPQNALLRIEISNNPLTSANLVYSAAQTFECSNTLLTSLDFSSVEWGVGNYVTITNNPNLQYLNFKNGHSDICYPPDECAGFSSCNISGNPQLQFACADDTNYPDGELGYFESVGLFASTYCSFVPGGDFNTILGTVTYDVNSNGCDPADAPAAGLPLQLSTGALVVGNTLANPSGEYAYYVQTGSQTITPYAPNSYFTYSPPSFTTSFSGGGNTATADFCLSANGVHPDLESAIFAESQAAPGFPATYQIAIKNKGTEVQSGTVNVVFDDAVLDLISATPPVTAASTNNLSWDFTNINPFETRTYTFTMSVNSPTESPAVNIGDILHFSADVVSIADETPADNASGLNQVVVGSFDPNDKAVSEGSQITLAQVADYLHYTIRFQNTGTASAANVVVKDLLGPLLQYSTFEAVSSSHPFRTTLTQGNKLEFFFEGINLPAAADDEPGSHGYIAFKIKPKNTVVVNNQIQNTADIFFDFNPPIVTNTVTTTVTALGVNEEFKSIFEVYPNPAQGAVTLDLGEATAKICVYNLLGQLVKSHPDSTGEVALDVSDLKSGTYLVEVRTTTGKQTKKLIKL